ncbi:MAG: hypothetical protein WCF23_17885 [Candidatus Nitrosopolaris sp.]
MSAKIKDFRSKIKKVQVIYTWTTNECDRSDLETMRDNPFNENDARDDLSLLEENENDVLKSYQ